MLGKIGLCVTLHKRHVHGPEAETEDREPDKLLLHEKFQKRNVPVQRNLQNDDIDPGLMIDDQQVPVRLAEALEPANPISRSVRNAENNSVAGDPELADTHDPARHHAPKACDRDQNLQQGKRQYGQ